MPKLELKTAQLELERGQIWPFYWLHGPEKLKSREFLKRIRNALWGEGSDEGGSQASEGVAREVVVKGLPREELFEGSEVDGFTVADSLMSPSLFGGVKLAVIRNAHLLKNPEALLELMGPVQNLKKEGIPAVCVCLSKDLDARRKFSKQLVEKAAVIACDEVNEAQKSAWIQYLAKRRKLELPAPVILKLSSLDPWSLEIIDQELEKYSLSDFSSDVILEDATQSPGGEVFLERFFQRDLKNALPLVSHFADSPESALPLLGLFGWNVRQFSVWISDRETGARNSKPSPYTLEQFRRWSPKWNLTDLLELQEELAWIDYNFKQTPLLPLGLWTTLVTRFCR